MVFFLNKKKKKLTKGKPQNKNSNISDSAGAEEEIPLSEDMLGELKSLGILDKEDHKITFAPPETSSEVNKQISSFIDEQTYNPHKKLSLTAYDETKGMNVPLASENRTKALSSLLSRLWTLIKTNKTDFEIIQSLLENHVITRPGENTFNLLAALRDFNERQSQASEEDKTNLEILVHEIRRGNTIPLAENLKKEANRIERKSRISKDEVKKTEGLKRASVLCCYSGTLTGLYDAEQALQTFDRAVILDRDNPLAWEMIGNLSWQLGNYKTAEKALTRALLLSDRKKQHTLVVNTSTKLAQIYRGREDEKLAASMEEETKWLLDNISDDETKKDVLTKMYEARAGKQANVGGAAGWQAATK